MTSRHTPNGYRRSTYSGGEVDAIAVYARATDRCYLIPIDEVAGLSMISLRLEPARNNQVRRVRWAHEYELRGSLERNWQVLATTQSLADDPRDGTIG